MQIRRQVAGDEVVINHLPPATSDFKQKFIAFARSDDIFGVDVETTAIDEESGGAFAPDLKLRMVQFGTANEAWCLDPHGPWRKIITTMLQNPKRRFVSHTNYDPLWILREFGIDLDQRAIDTKPMADLIHPGVTADKDLKALSDRYIDAGLTEAQTAMMARFKELAPTGQRVGSKLKDWGFTNIPLDDEAFGEYGGLDAIYVRRLLDVFNEILRSKKMGKLSRREQRIQRLATGMQVRGHKVDRDWTHEVLRSVEDEFLESDERLKDTLGFSPRSPKLAGWLEDHGCSFFEFSEKGNPVLDKETLPVYADLYEDDDTLGPIFRDKLVLSKNTNLLSNLKQIVSASAYDGHVHPAFRTQQAHTGRMSIVRPAMQTFKKTDKRLRGCFVFEDGTLGVGADYDSQEIRIAAAFSGDPLLMEIVTSGQNQHVLTAVKMYGDKFEGKEESPELYKGVKILDFAQQYGAGPLKIGRQLGMPDGPMRNGKPTPNPEALKMWNAWRAAYAGLVRWTDRMGERSVVINPWGRQIPNPWRRYANGNYMVQSSGRDVLGDALVELEDRGYASWLWLPIHDEIVLQVPEDQAEFACKLLEESMYCEFGNDVELTASAEIIGNRWGGGS